MTRLPDVLENRITFVIPSFLGTQSEARAQWWIDQLISRLVASCNGATVIPVKGYWYNGSEQLDCEDGVMVEAYTNKSPWEVYNRLRPFLEHWMYQNAQEALFLTINNKAYVLHHTLPVLFGPISLGDKET